VVVACPDLPVADPLGVSSSFVRCSSPWREHCPGPP